MPSRRPKTRRMDAAIAALTPLGFEKTQIRKTVNMLVKEYKHPESGWFFVEEDYYRLPIETMIKEQDEEQQRSKVVNEEQEVENEEQEEGDGAFEEATERATERENSGREIVLFEAGSSSNIAHSGRGEYPADERALTNLADYCEMVQGIELSQVSPSSVPPEGTPSITWLSQEEEEEEEQQYFVVKRAPRSAPKRGASRGWISEEDEEDDD